MASKKIEVAALGRPLFPGMLYDCREDTFIPGVTLWDKKSLREDLDTRSQPMTDLKFSSSDSLSSKSSLLDVSASLKASFLGGLVEVGGSAKFLHDTKSSNQQSRVTMYYSETSRFEQLTMSQLNQITYKQVFEQKTATHVVTAVLYGAQAVMVFERTFSEEEEKQKIEGELDVMVKSIPGFSIEGSGAVQMTDGDKKMAESISCTFHGDFRLDHNPTTYMEALDVYKNLPLHLKENPQNAVPIKVWLYPLSLLDNKAAQLEREITTSLVSKTEDIIEGLREAKRTCTDISRKPLVNAFRDIKERLQLFQGSLNIYQMVLLKAVARVLPAIRGGEMEKSLEGILKIHYSSPFFAGRIKQWLDGAKSELNLLSSQTKILEEIKTKDSDHLNSILLDPNIDVVVCLTFTSLKYEDLYISDLEKFLESEDFKELDVVKKLYSNMAESSEKWFNNPDVISKMRENLSLFRGFSEANKAENRYGFIISAISDSSILGSSINLYEKGKLTDKDFQPVSKPPQPEVKKVLKGSVSLKLQKSPTGETVQYRVEYQKVNEEQWHIINTPDEDFTLNGLELGKQHFFRYRIVGKVGVSEASDTIGPILSSGKRNPPFFPTTHPKWPRPHFPSLTPSPERARSDAPLLYAHDYMMPSPEARETVSFGLGDILLTTMSDYEDFGPVPFDDALPPSGQEAQPSASLSMCFCTRLRSLRSNGLISPRQFMPRRNRESSSTSPSQPRECPPFKKEFHSRSRSDQSHPPPTTVWGAHGRPFLQQRPHRRLQIGLSGFRVNAGPSGSCPDFQYQDMSGWLQARPSCFCRDMPQAFRSHGRSLPGPSSGAAPHSLPLVDETYDYNGHLTGRGAMFKGHPACSIWTEETQAWHINCLELRAVFLGLRHFHPFLTGHHVIVRTDNMAVVSHVNRQGGFQTRTLDRHARCLFLWAQDSKQFTLDLTTAHKRLCLSESDRVLTYTDTDQLYTDNPDRFDGYLQVLCKESVCERCYWEIEWTGNVLCISVSYKSISRKGEGKECGFGHNDQSWSLECSSSSYSFRHNEKETKLPVESVGSRVGVYVDTSAGTLSFYSLEFLSDRMSLIHTVQTTFTHTLYPGFSVFYGSVKLC
ncbi:uncharacterized protein [Pseudorasbora parva]|uniref:uncharacterized protein n=1 Tax=Pseudorasbora parva TaxID=51549 RepID=UPI00351EE354